MKKILYIIILFASITNAQNGEELFNVWNDERWFNYSNKGHCVYETIEGEWELAEEQYVDTLKYNTIKHKWVYGDITDNWNGALYACANCCNMPDRQQYEKRVCKITGIIEERTNIISGRWVAPKKNPFEKIIDSLKTLKSN